MDLVEVYNFMNLVEVYNAYMKLSVYGKEPEIGEYFGVITYVNYLEPYYSDGILYKYSILNSDGQYPLLFKRIDEDTIVDVLTGIPFVFGPSCRHYKDAAKQQEQFQKYRKIGLYFDPITNYSVSNKWQDPMSSIEGNNVYLKVDEKFKMLYSEEMGKGLKEKLKFCAEKAHKKFENALTRTINTTHGIASVDNAIYDMEKKHKVKSLTKPNDDQK